MVLIDTHCHLDAAEFDHDRNAVVERATAMGVVSQIVPAIRMSNWRTIRVICTQYRNLFPAYGLHPIYLSEHRPEHLTQLRDWIEHDRPYAIGECGLDFFIRDLDPATQQYYLHQQLQIAREYDLPVIVHARRSVDAVIAAIRNIGRVRGVIHSFSGSPEQARQLWKLGFFVGLGGPVTYERAQRLRRLVTTMPLEQLLLETDAPDQPDATIRGQRNEPSRLPVILETIAKLRHQPMDEIASRTTANAKSLFNLPCV
ncbi:MAG: TatD family hydrolase [Xanthomonadaceae bacterium]|jgi:TatD DNase family protein|nr:TatD family hydrolase [Xanthomonadaceae bacterium]